MSGRLLIGGITLFSQIQAMKMTGSTFPTEVHMSNELITARQSFEGIYARRLRLMAFALAAAKKAPEGADYPVTIRVADYAEIMGVELSNASRDIAKGAKALCNPAAGITFESGFVPWLAATTFEDMKKVKGEYTFSISAEIMPHIVPPPSFLDALRQMIIDDAEEVGDHDIADRMQKRLI